MQNTAAIQEDLVFGLDIGTRSIVGVVGFQDRKGFHVVAMAQQEHETRAMLDGQIHDIYKVGDTIRKVKNDLERQLDRQLSDVCIAAAYGQCNGRICIRGRDESNTGTHLFFKSAGS